MNVFQPSRDGATCMVRVTPRAGRSLVAGVRDGTLLVKLAAAPVDDAANDALIVLLSTALDLPSRDVRIVSGQRSRTKRIAFAGAAAAELERRCAALLSR